jgi:hypothetical protein
MESNRSKNYGNEQQEQQPKKGAPKRRLNELANEDENDGQFAKECQVEAQPENCSKRNRQTEKEWDLEVCIFLIKI